MSDFTSFINVYLTSIITSSIIATITAIVYLILRYGLRQLSSSFGLKEYHMRGIFSIVKIGLMIIATVLIIFQFSTASGIVASVISLSAGTIIGFASINTVGNAISGVLLLLTRPFKIGDRIRISDDDSLVGDVIEISLIYTKIKTITNELVSVPNQVLLQKRIVNYSGLDLVAATIEITMSYDNDSKKIESLLLESAKMTRDIVSSPPPNVIMKRFDNFAAAYQLRAYTSKPNEYVVIQSELRKNVYNLFQKNGLDLTTPYVSRTADNSITQKINENEQSG